MIELSAPNNDKNSGISNFEIQYLDLLSYVLTTGQDRENRTGIKTRMTHGVLLRHNMDTGFPLLTTKKLNFENIKAELFWFLSGSTDCSDLDELNPGGFNIWKANAQDFYNKKLAWLNKICDPNTSEAEAKRYSYLADYLKLNSDTNCGDIYGESWRNFGDCKNCRDGGIDQISALIEEIINNPSSRRLMISNYNPHVHLDGADRSNLDACLPPCHVLFQIDIDQYENKMNASLYMRSADLFLGVPYNVSSYALLLKVLSYIVYCMTGKLYNPGMLVIYMHDAHIYHNHFDQCLLQLSRKESGYPLPKVIVKSKAPMTLSGLDSPKSMMNSVELFDYKHHPYIKAEMAV